MKGDYEQAETVLREVMIYAQERGNWMSQLWVQLRLGHVLLHAGNLTEARQLLTETAQNFGKDGYTIGAVFALEGMAELFSVVGKPESAARLIGCADLIRETIQDARPEFEQANVDKIMAACLAKIGEVAFSDAYEEGQKMTLEEAVAFVVEVATLSSLATTAQSQSSQMPVLRPKHPRKKSSKRKLTQGP